MILPVIAMIVSPSLALSQTKDNKALQQLKDVEKSSRDAASTRNLDQCEGKVQPEHRHWKQGRGAGGYAQHAEQGRTRRRGYQGLHQQAGDRRGRGRQAQAVGGAAIAWICAEDSLACFTAESGGA